MRIVISFDSYDPQIDLVAAELKVFLLSEEGEMLVKAMPNGKEICILDYRGKEEIPNTAKCTFHDGVFETDIATWNTNPWGTEWIANTPLPNVVWILREYGRMPYEEIVTYVREKLKTG